LNIWKVDNMFYAKSQVQSTAHQTVHSGLCIALISKALALISNCQCIARGAVDRTANQYSLEHERSSGRSVCQPHSSLAQYHRIVAQNMYIQTEKPGN
jgi:hypothetical protein